MQEQFEYNEVSRLLGDLNKVEAPKDFEFRVRAGIAGGKPADTSRMSWLVKATVPLVLVLMIGGYFGYRALRTEPVSSPSQPEKAQQNAPVAQPIQAPPIAQQPIGDPNIAKRDNVVIQPDGTKPQAPKTDNQPGGGSYEEAVKPTNPIYPRGVDPRKTQADASKGQMPGARMSLSSFLSTAGITGGFAAGGWHVSSIADRSMAASSGLKAGDVIEYINDQPITGNIDLPSTFSLKSMRVRRNGASVTIPLKN